MERRRMKQGMTVWVTPAERGRLYPRNAAVVVALPSVKRGKAKVRFEGGRTALVPLWRLLKP